MLSIVLSAAVAVQTSAPVPRPPDPIIDIVKYVLPISETSPGRYAGAGWDQLIADGANSQFFMIGEQHGVADIVRFATTAQRVLAERGYTHAAIEVGPWSTDVAERQIRSGQGKLAAYLRKPGYRISIPFLFQQEEVHLAEQIVGSSPDRVDALWGLDQEFVFSGPVVVDVLGGLARTSGERASVLALASRVTAKPELIGAAPWAENAALETAFAGNPKGREVVAALKLSNEIYAPFTGRGGTGYEGNLRRENYLKANFVKAFNAAEKRNGRPPKVFLKFGGNHAQKGFTGTNVPGLGNFLAEWGAARNFSFTNIMVECVGGQAHNPIEDKHLPCEAYYSKDSAIARMPKPDRMTLVDLRPLRPLLRRMTDLDEESRKLILSFDYYLAIKDVRPATATASLRREAEHEGQSR